MSVWRRALQNPLPVVAWAMVAIAAGYWLVYVAVAPVTTADSHIYNLSRLLIAERGGLFGNNLWTTPHQIVFPWSFDAIHLPFVHLRRLENLPSFLCLCGLGVLAVLLCLRQGAAAVCAPVAVMALLASPTVAFQATTSKNDMGVAFFALAAFYCALRCREQPVRWPWMAGFAVSVGMCAGAKTTGLAISALLVAGAVWACRGHGWRWLAMLTAMLVASLVLFGSVETYANNIAIFGNWIGDREFIARHSNEDGVGGAFANLVRYAFNSLGSGLESEALTRGYRVWLTERCAAFLHVFGLDHSGIAAVSASDTKFLLGAHEVASNYGVVGFVVVPLAIAAACMRRFRSVDGQLAIFGFAILGVLCLTTGWQKYNMRLLLPAAVPILLSAVLFGAGMLAARPRFALALQTVLFLLALAVPLCSWNRTPGFIAWGWRARETVAMQEKLPLLAEWKGVHELAKSSGIAGCAVILGADDWALPYLNDRKMRWEIIPNREARESLTMEDIRKWLPARAGGRWLVLASQGSAKVSLPNEAVPAGVFEKAGRAYLIDVGRER